MTNQPAPSTPPADDLQAKLKSAQDQLAKTKLELDKAQASKKPVAPLRAVRPAPAAQAPAGGTGKSWEQELEEFANAQAREALVLRTAIKYGLQEEDLDGDYSTPLEVEMAAKVIKLERSIKTLGETAQAAKDAAAIGQPPKPPEGQADTGGPTGREATRANRVKKMRDEAAAAPRTTKARYLTLQAAYADPSKHMAVGPQEELEE